MSEHTGVGPVLLAVVEALLFVTDRPLSVAEICLALEKENVQPEVVEAALELLADRYKGGADEGRGFHLVQQGDGWQFRTVTEVTQWLTEFTGLRPSRLSRAALETLSIVAYRQPCTRADVERIRGVDSGGILRALLDRRLLRLAGRRNEPGRPNIYATTREFLDTFGLTSLQEMPNLREFTMLGEEDMEAVSAMFDDDSENQVTMEEFSNRRALEDGEGPTPGLEPQPGEALGVEPGVAGDGTEAAEAGDVAEPDAPTETPPAAEPSVEPSAEAPPPAGH